MGNAFSVNATLHSPCRLIILLSRFLKLASELSLKIFVDVDDNSVMVKESFPLIKLSDNV